MLQALILPKLMPVLHRNSGVGIVCWSILVLCVLFLSHHGVESFPVRQVASQQERIIFSRQPTSSSSCTPSTSTALFASLSPERKRALLSRTGPYFSLDRTAGTIAFGAIAQLTTPLPSDDPAVVTAWLEDAPSIAQSIWDPQLTTVMGKNVYRLETTPLQFVMLQIAPSVDVEMKTILSQSDSKEPIFTLQSIRFNPNIQSGLPGMPQIDAEALGIVIETAGYLRQTTKKKEECTVSGVISFQTSGSLPPPLRILPDGVLQAAADTINQQVVQLAVRSFQQGARINFEAFARQQAQQEAAAAAATAAAAEPEETKGLKQEES